MYAMRSPTMMVPASTPSPPNHTIATVEAFITMSMTGMSTDMQRFVKM